MQENIKTYQNSRPYNNSIVSLIVLIFIGIIFTIQCGGGDKLPEKTEAEIQKEAELKRNIQISYCKCYIDKIQVEKGEYLGRVQIIKPKYEKVVKCKASLINKNEKKIDTGFNLKWDIQTKTGASVETIKVNVQEFLPKGLKVNWDTLQKYTYDEERIADIQKRIHKTVCSLSDIKEVE